MSDTSTPTSTLESAPLPLYPASLRLDGDAVDKLADSMEQETDKAKRNAMIAQATKLYVDDFAYIPLHQQAVVWAARKNIDLVQPADNSFPLRFVNVK